jgi:3-hydroxyacyl-CoA dehydrogenase/enoyl-CoA hydratase/3-hydroxybutyryl-CoA epimerase
MSDLSDVMKYEQDAEGIVTITMDMPGRSVNVLNEQFMQAFKDTVERIAADKAARGVIITSAKDTFVAGAELEFLYAMDDPQEVFNSVQDMKAYQRRLETLGIPVVAAINGAALGGGWEVALATHYRVAIDNPKTKLGLPEVTLGLLPGDGGVTRMTRLLGLQAAFPYLTEGRQISPAEAKAAGLVDALASDRDDMLRQARAWVLANPQAAQPWDRDDYRMPGGVPASPKLAPVLMTAPAMLRQKTWRNYPAPECIAAAMVEGAAVDFDTALRIESRYFAHIATGQVAKNMMSTFWFQLNAIKNGGSRPAGIPPTETRKVGVLGAGLMGHGIAHATAMAGMDVVLKDVTQENADRGKAAVKAILDKRIAKGRMDAAKAAAVLDRIVPTANVQDLRDCDLIIEAVFEDRAVKARVTRETEAVIAADAVFASNTSTMPISGLAEASVRPQNFIGLHFFSPVDRMNLVEIIVGKLGNAQTLAKAFDYVLKIGKTPIVVNDSRGFYTSRVFGTYVREGLELLVEGQHPRAIEWAGLKAGMPMGPLEVADMVGLNLALHITEQTDRDMAAEGQHYEWSAGDRLLAMIVKEKQRNGKNAGAGFYDYPPEGKRLWPGTARLAGDLAAGGRAAEDRAPVGGAGSAGAGDSAPVGGAGSGTVAQPGGGVQAGPKLAAQEMIDRLLFTQCLETVRCRDEAVVEAVADANIGSIFGWGFAPYSGGTLQFINAFGLPAFVSRSRELAASYGARFEPPASLVAMAEAGQRF